MIAVHDVGMVGEDVFVAMEYVPGRTLSEWSAAEEPPVVEVLDRFRAAGKGVAAAHEAVAAS